MKRISRKILLAVMVMILGIGVVGFANAATIDYFILPQILNRTLANGESTTFSFLVDQFTVPPAEVLDARLRIDATRVDTGLNTVMAQVTKPVGTLNDGIWWLFGYSSTTFPVASLFSSWDGGYLDVTVTAVESLKLNFASLYVKYSVPELGTMFLLASGLIGLVGYRRSRRMV